MKLTKQKSLVYTCTIIIAIMTLVSCNSTSNKQASKTSIALSTEEIDLGEVKLNTEVEYELSFVNSGEVPLTIYRVATSCGCTEVEWSQKPIRPQKSSVIKIKYKDKYPGFIHKTITIYGNLEEPIEVKLKGELIEGI